MFYTFFKSLLLLFQHILLFLLPLSESASSMRAVIQDMSYNYNANPDLIQVLLGGNKTLYHVCNISCYMIYLYEVHSPCIVFMILL